MQCIFGPTAELARFPRGALNFLLRPVRWRLKGSMDGGVVMSATSSNCQTEVRVRVMEALARVGVPIHNYGSCLHNRDFAPCDVMARDAGYFDDYTPSDQDIWGPGQQWKLDRGAFGQCMTVMDPLPSKYRRDYSEIVLAAERYKFYIAMDRAPWSGKVTEKFFNCLLSNAVCIVNNRSSYEEYAPGPHSFVALSDFGGDVDALARYISDVDHNDTAYREFFAWKKAGIRGSLLNAFDEGYDTLRVRTCEYFARRLGIIVDQGTEHEGDASAALDGRRE